MKFKDFKEFFKRKTKVVAKTTSLVLAAVIALSPMAVNTQVFGMTVEETPVVKLAELDEKGSAPKTTIADFKDNVSVHWGAGTIQWGLDRDMVGGYPDGTFQADKAVTEAEFATMLARYADNTDKTLFGAVTPGGHWSQGYYNSLIDFELPFNGYLEDSENIKNTTVTRVRVAQIFAAKYGFNLGEQQAVYFLYENELSQGRTEKNYGGYSPNAYLTRAEIVQFFRNVDNQGTKTLTFLGKQSVKGACDADTIVGIEGVALDTTPVDFTKWAPEVDISGKITTYVGTDGKVYANMKKVTEPVAIEGNKYNKYVNYVDFSKGVADAGLMNNSVVLYKGTELPASGGFKLPEQLLKDDGKSLGGIVGIEFDGNALMQTGSFIDKVAFRAFISNLQFFEASQAQIDKAREIFDEQVGVRQEYSNTEDLRLFSTKKNSTLLISYGDKNVYIEMYHGREVTLGTEIVVD